jgi:hypothetical protein
MRELILRTTALGILCASPLAGLTFTYGGARGQQASTSQQPASGQSSTAAEPETAKAGATRAGKTQAGDASAPKKLSDLLESKIRAEWAAYKNKDKKAYGEFLADDFMAVEEDGNGERTKAQVLREVDQSVVHDYQVQLFRVDPIAPGAQLVTYENMIQFPRGSANRFEKIFISEIWVRRNSEWKLWRYQATRVK